MFIVSVNQRTGKSQEMFAIRQALKVALPYLKSLPIPADSYPLACRRMRIENDNVQVEKTAKTREERHFSQL